MFFCRISDDTFTLLTPATAHCFQVILIRKKQIEESLIKICCLDPSVAFTPVQGFFRSIAISSGTLSPFNSFSSELKTPFPTQLSTQHVVDKTQICLMSITRFNSYELTSKFAILKDHKRDIFEGLANILVQVAPIVPGGILLFLTSYYIKTEFIKHLKKEKHWDSIKIYKNIFEEKPGSKVDSVIRQFSKTKGNGIFIGVYRGSVSEGIDLPDNLVRLVIVFGVPYPNISDPEIQMKKDYNQKMSGSDSSFLKGNEWYSMQAFRTLFQSIGRSVRHQNDYGAVLLVDSRFPDSIHLFPNWMKQSYIGQFSTGDMLLKLQNFYSQMKTKFSNGDNQNIDSILMARLSFQDYQMIVSNPHFQLLRDCPIFQKVIGDGTSLGNPKMVELLKHPKEFLEALMQESQPHKETVKPQQRIPDSPPSFTEINHSTKITPTKPSPLSLQVFCCQCHKSLFTLNSHEDFSELKSEKKGLFLSTGFPSEEKFIQIDNSNLRDNNLIEKNSFWSDTELIAYMSLICQCGICIGSKILAVNSANVNDLHAIFLGCSKIAIKSQNLFFPFDSLIDNE